MYIGRMELVKIIGALVWLWLLPSPPQSTQFNEWVGIGASPARILDVVGVATPGTGNTARVKGTNASLEVMNNAGTVDWNFGVKDATGEGLIGRGYSPSQGLTPHILLGQDMQTSFNTSTPFGATLNVLGASDWMSIWMRDGGEENLSRYIHYSGSDNPLPILTGIAARGSKASPQPLQTNDHLFIIDGRGYYSTAPGAESDTSAQMAMRAASGWTSISRSSYIEFYTTPISSITPKRVITFTDKGTVRIDKAATISASLSDTVELGVRVVAGKLELVVVFPSGAAKVIAAQD